MVKLQCVMMATFFCRPGLGKFSADILVGIQQPSDGECSAAAKAAKARLIEFQQRPPSMILPMLRDGHDS